MQIWQTRKLMSDSTSVVTNQILRTILVITNRRLLPHLQEVSLLAGQILQESGTEISSIYFPQTARLALLLVMSDRSLVEIDSVGNEGLVGLPAILGSTRATNRTVIQISGTAIELPVDVLQEEFRRGGELQQLLLLYTQAQLNKIAQIAACRTHHSIEQRFARWLLLIHDNSQYDKLPLTQKFISQMLGVRRASITEIAISFQKQGIIQYSRGQITILNRAKLESVACECYSKITSEYQRLIEPKLEIGH